MGAPVSCARVEAGVGIALSMGAERVPLDWIPINSCLCAVRLDGSAHINISQLVVVLCSSYLRMRPLTAISLRWKANSIGRSSGLLEIMR